jgi:hypothetical protein
MKVRSLIPALFITGLASLTNPAAANDQFASALLGAGAGAVIGHAVGGHDAALFGGIVGAMVGAAANDRDGPRVVVRAPFPVYQPPRVAVYETPVMRYQPVNYWRYDSRWEPSYNAWRGDFRDGRREDRRDDRRDDYHGDRHDDRGDHHRW